MRVVVRGATPEDARVVEVRDPAMTLADVAAAGGVPWAVEVIVDGERMPAAATVGRAGLLDGAELAPASADPALDDAAPAPLVEIHQIAGLSAGGSVGLPAGRYDLGSRSNGAAFLGRGVVDEPRLRLVVTPDGACRVEAPPSGEVLVDGILLDGGLVVTDQYLQVDGAAFRLTPAAPRRRPSGGRSGDGLIVFDRPPGGDPDDAGSARPSPPPPPVATRPVGRTPPAGAGGRQELTDLVWEAGQRLAVGWRQALDAARAAPPDVAELAARARVLAPALWERAAGRPDCLEVGLGMGTGRWRPPTSSSEVPIELAGIFQTTRELPLVPIVGDLGAGPVGVIGPAAAVRAVARWVIVQVAVLSGPDAVSVGEASGGRSAEWGWLRWLPHFVSGGPVAPCHLTIVDGCRSPGATMEAAAAGRPCLVLAAGREQLPASCVAIVQVSEDGTVTVSDHSRGQRRDGLAVGLSLEVATSVARDLAPIVLAPPAGGHR